MNNEHDPNQRWSARRVSALVLTLILVALATYTWQKGVGNPRELYLLGAGAVLGFYYVFRGGSLPAVVRRTFRINADDDSGNLSPKLYLSVLSFVVIAAAAVYYFFGPTRR